MRTYRRYVPRVKLVDRYMLRAFLVPLFYCLVAFSLIFVVFDLFDNFGDFMDAHTGLLDVMKYYVILLPSILVRIVPIAVLLAVIYALFQLTRNNELIAFRACGLSLTRLVAPYMIAGFVISLVVFFTNEFVGPDSAYWCYQFLNQQRRSTTDIFAPKVIFRDDATARNWYVGQFNTQNYGMKDVLVTQHRHEDESWESVIHAAGGRWLDGYWWFTNVEVQAYGPDSNPQGPPRYLSDMEMTEYTEKPEEFLRQVKIKKPELLSSRDLLAYVRSNPRITPEYTAIHMTNFWDRLAFPWASFVVVLMGIPVGGHTGRKGAIVNVGLCLLMLAGYFVTMLMSLALGKKMILAPWLAGWLPIIIFLALGIYLVRRMK